MNSSDKDVFAYIGGQLPHFIMLAFDEYRKRVDRNSPDDGTKFVAKQTECQAALGHVTLLLRVAERLPRHANTLPAGNASDLAALMRDAKADLDRRHFTR